MTAPLRIAIDARELAGHVTGAGTYLTGLLAEWLRDPALAITLVSHQPLAAQIDRLPGIARAARVVRPGAGGTLWEQTALPRAAAHAGDVLFAPAYTAPLASRLPLVLAIHDVSFAAHPEWFAPRERFRRNLVTRRAARKAAAVVTISEFSAGEIAAHLGIPRGRIAVIPPAAPARPAAIAPVATRDPLVVFVGSIFNRRRVPDLIAAFDRVARARAGARLVLAGANRTWPHQDIAGLIARAEHGSRITWLDRPSNDEIAALLSRASVSAFLSEYEGFALTPLEGLAHGVAPVLLDTPVAREVYGDAAVLVPAGAIAATAAAILRLLDSPGDRAALLARAEPLWTRYDAARAARDTLDVIRSAAR